MTESRSGNKIFSRKVTWWGVGIKFSSKAKASFPTEGMMEWLTDRICNVIEIKNNEMIQSFRKELELVVFIVEGFLHKKIQKK